MYRLVVAMLTWPSQLRITLTSTPDCNKCIAVVCRLYRWEHSRHTTAVHLLEAGVEMNVIRGWLGHADVTTTNRYAEITVRSKEAAVRACEAASEFAVALGRRRLWKDDPALLAWLASL